MGCLFTEPGKAVVSRQNSVPDVQLMPESTVALGCFGIMGFAHGSLHIWLHSGVVLRRRLVTPPRDIQVDGPLDLRKVALSGKYQHRASES